MMAHKTGNLIIVFVELGMICKTQLQPQLHVQSVQFACSCTFPIWIRVFFTFSKKEKSVATVMQMSRNKNAVEKELKKTSHLST